MAFFIYVDFGKFSRYRNKMSDVCFARNVSALKGVKSIVHAGDKSSVSSSNNILERRKNDPLKIIIGSV